MSSEKKEKKNFKISIRSKIILSYILVILLMAFFSIIFVSMFYDRFMISDAQAKLERDAKDFAFILEDNSQYREELDDYLVNHKFSQFSSSLMLTDLQGNVLFEYNSGLSYSNQEEFAKEVIDKVVNNSANTLNFGNTEYSVFLQPVSNKSTGTVLAYLLLFYPTNKFLITSNVFSFFFLAIIISSGFATIIGSLISGTLTKNIKKLKRRADNLANRQFNNVIQIDSHDEIKDLSDSFDIMAESIREYDNNQRTFLQNASHEFRTPLTSIKGYVEGMRDGIFTVDRATNMIIDQVERLETLVNEVILLSKIETTEGIFHADTLTLRELISEAAKRVNGLMLNCRLVLAVTDYTDVEFVGDIDKLATVITNLVSNCSRFADSRIEIEPKVSDNLITITVSDDGPGISDEDMDKLFVRFYKGKKGNHGLGLSIAQAIVNSHKGTIRAYNKKDRQGIITGAAFEFTIPTDNKPEDIKLT